MPRDIYSTPESELETEENSSEITNLATRWQRLWASLIDGLTIAVITIPTMYFTGGFDGIAQGIQPSLGYTLLIAALGIIVFLIINAKSLIHNGQTVGKRLLGIKIVDLNGSLPSIKQHLIKRYTVYFIPGQIPVVGQVFSLINLLFIFAKQKRCVHDYAAGTKVVKS